MDMTICIFATGGTIDKVHHPVNETLVFPDQSSVPSILKTFHIPDFHFECLMLKDSLDITEKDRHIILKAVQTCPSDQIVITHGTSTMSVSADYLADHINNKTVVLTGAMRPFSFIAVTVNSIWDALSQLPEQWITEFI
jgi:L-asparaginase